ncbi:hypothetical protein PHJA_002652400 [Phtheirospermum japonicum]|uniref:Uncharacterized protein n=1 Tax=Phtheirospermum japonicum TaxID=374723 RepID=A0A830D375_9LAMI|nr:hypothetical protein PHJA_002652400 [Phtheirospermum japonicum]
MSMQKSRIYVLLEDEKDEQTSQFLDERSTIANVSHVVRSLAVESRDVNLRAGDLLRVLEGDVGSPDVIVCLEKELYNNAYYS